MSHTEWMKTSGFCKRIKQARTRKHMVQEDVVKQVEGRFSVSILEAIENGAICPSIGRVAELAQIYGCSLDWLCGLDKAKEGKA